jgi:hypothetical protein
VETRIPYTAALALVHEPACLNCKRPADISLVATRPHQHKGRLQILR